MIGDYVYREFKPTYCIYEFEVFFIIIYECYFTKYIYMIEQCWEEMRSFIRNGTWVRIKINERQKVLVVEERKRKCALFLPLRNIKIFNNVILIIMYNL